MEIGILGGTGPAGTALGARLASVGYDVVLGSRSQERAAQIRDELVAKWEGHSLALEPGDNARAAAAEVVVVATPWDGAIDTVKPLADRLAGKVVISMANALVRVGGEFQPLVLPRGSVAEHLQAVLPGARVVAAYQHLPAKELGHLGEDIRSDVLICSDDRAATEVVSEITRKIPVLRPLDAGSLSNAMAIEALTATMLQLNMRYKTRVAPTFTGIP